MIFGGVATSENTAHGRLRVMHDYTPENFLSDARDWLDWVRTGTAHVSKYVEIALTKPEGFHHDSNLVLDSEGQVWQPVWHPRGGFVRLTRSNTMSAYTRTSDFIEESGHRAYNGGSVPFEIGGHTFVAKGGDQPEADWCWEARDGSSTLQYYRAAQAMSEAGVRLGEALLALPPEALGAWAKARAENAPHDGSKCRSYEHVGADWGHFLATFGLPEGRNVPDNGALLCGVHLLVDRAAGLATSYAY